MTSPKLLVKMKQQRIWCIGLENAEVHLCIHSFMISSVREYRRILAVLTSVPGLEPWSGQKSNIHVLLLSNTAGPRQKSRFTPTELLRSHPSTTSGSFIFRTVTASPVPTLRREKSTVFSTHHVARQSPTTVTKELLPL